MNIIYVLENPLVDTTHAIHKSTQFLLERPKHLLVYPGFCLGVGIVSWFFGGCLAMAYQAVRGGREGAKYHLKGVTPTEKYTCRVFERHNLAVYVQTLQELKNMLFTIYYV